MRLKALEWGGNGVKLWWIPRHIPDELPTAREFSEFASSSHAARQVRWPAGTLVVQLVSDSRFEAARSLLCDESAVD
jgi:hypothetical protein